IRGNQPGDPDKAADVLIEVAGSTNPPLHLFLGADAYNMARAKMESLKQDMDAVEGIATATNF
ncbi:MAG TPA: short-chain dehydrogenase/reductase, partial [Mucilaginibacter sp.]